MLVFYALTQLIWLVLLYHLETYFQSPDPLYYFRHRILLFIIEAVTQSIYIFYVILVLYKTIIQRRNSRIASLFIIIIVRKGRRS